MRQPPALSGATSLQFAVGGGDSTWAPEGRRSSLLPGLPAKHPVPQTANWADGALGGGGAQNMDAPSTPDSDMAAQLKAALEQI